MKKNVLIILLFLIPSAIMSQVLTQHFAKGEAVKNGLKVGKRVTSNGIIEMPKVDVEKLMKEDAEMAGEDVPYRFGYGFETSYTLENGEWEDVDEGRLWSLRFKSNGAVSLNFVFEDFSLPNGAYLNIVNSDETIVYGPVTSENIPEDGYFLTDIIPDSLVTIYLYEPNSQEGKSTLKIKKVVHGYQNFYVINDQNGNSGNSAPCNNPVEEGFPNYYKESNAVALILLEDGTSLCSGSLILSTDLSFKPYLLTAFHCVNTEYYADTNIPTDVVASSSEKANVNHWAIKFGFRQQSTYAITFNGADFRAGWYYSDFALVELYENAKQFAHLTWLGWDRTGNVPASGVGIHHPVGDYMKISIDNDLSQTSMWIDNYNNGTQHWLEHWDSGITQPGSSGSPLLNESKRVVGQLHGVQYENGHNEYILQNYPCLINYASYGKFDISWNGGGNNDSRLSNWLDPIGTGQTTTDSSHPIYISGSNLVCRNSSGSYSVSNLPSGYTVTWSSSNPLSVSLQTSGNNCFLTHNYIISHKVTLTATLYRGSQMIRTVTKNVVCHGDIIIRYSQAATSNHPAIVNQLVDNSRVIMVTQNVPATITSANFLGMNVSCNYSSIASWSYDGNQTITFTYPSTGIGGTGLIFSASGSPNCNDFQVTALPYPSGQRKSLIVNNSGNRLELSIVPLSDADNEQTDKNLLWTLNVYEVSTGRKIFSQDYDTSQCTVDISGWKQGVYILQAVVGDEITYEKIKI